MNSSTEQRCSDSDDSSDGTSETRCSLDPDRAGGRRRSEAPGRDSAAVAVELEEGRGVVVLVQHLRYRRLHEVAHLHKGATINTTILEQMLPQLTRL